MNLRRLSASLQFLLYRHGWPASVGLLLCVAALAAYPLLVLPMQREADSVRVQLPQLRKSLAQRPAAPQTEAQRLTDLVAGLPAPARALTVIDTIHRSAGEHGVALSNGEYRLLQSGGAPWMRYQITLPARAPYASARAWLADVMNAEPALALDDLSLRRESTGDPTVEMRVRMILFLRAP